MPKTPLLSGPDRIEFWEKAGRSVRQGSFSDLKVPDLERVRQALARKDAESAIAYLETINPLYLGLCAILLEWSIGYPETLATRVGAEKESLVTRQAYEIWREVVVSEKEQDAERREAGQCVLDILAPPRERSREQSGPRDRERAFLRMNEVPVRGYAETIRTIRERRFEEAVPLFEKYARQTRGRHDFLCQYLWVYPSAINKTLDQRLCEEVMRDSLQALSFYQPMIKLLIGVSPEEAAAILAEHLRAHFSGEGRRGAVEIVEDADTYRLILDPCGSGGAMRRATKAKRMSGLEDCPETSGATWGLSGSVSSYCSHCAQNEMALTDLIGYPLWVADFNPDPMKPCAWVVYKDPAKIPEKYFARIARKRDPSKFQP